MNDHEHKWLPNPTGEFRQYICECGASGFRKRINDPVQAHVKPRKNEQNVGGGSGSSRKGKRGPGGW